MRIFNKFILFCYTVIFLFIGVCLVYLGLHVNGWIDLSNIIDTLISYPYLDWLLGLIGALLILVSLSVANISHKRFQAEKTIGYSTAGGQVIISLGAIEDYIRRLTQTLQDVKELRSEVFVTRRGIEIESRVVLWASTQLPEITEKVQTTIRGHVQELLSGIEKAIFVNVHVVKIVQREHPHLSDKKTKPEIPFIP